MTSNTTKVRAALLSALMVLSVFAGTVAFAGTASAALPDATNQADADSGTVTINGSVTEERGDVVTINTSFNGTETGLVQIGSDDVGYNTTVAVRDGGDGHVGLEMNTYLAGRTYPDLVYNLTEESQSDGDAIVGVWRHSNRLDSPLEAATYDITTSTESVSAPNDGWALLNPDDRKSLELQERGTKGVQVWTAPRDTDTSNLSSVLQRVNQTGQVAEGDLAVVQLQASGIYGRLQGDNVKQRLYDESNGFMLTIAESNSGVNQDVLKMAMTSDAVRTVYTDTANNSLFVVVDTSKTPNTVSGDSWNWETGEEYVASWTLNESNPMIAADSSTPSVEAETAEQNFTLVEANATIDNLDSNNQLSLPAAENAQVSGTTTLAPGSEVTLRVSSAESSSVAFLKTVETTVGQSGSFSTTVDMNNAEPGTNFNVVVLAPDGTQLSDQVSGRVTQAQPETETPGETETPTETSTSTETSTPAETTTTTITTTAADGGGDGGGGGGDTTTTTQQTPGFGVAVAVVALLAAALIAVRREN